MNMNSIIPSHLLNSTTVIALDLEGTLVSNAASQFPRPGLAGFLEFCRKVFTHVVIFSAVRPQRVREVLHNLVGREDVPEWVGELPIVPWSMHQDTYKESGSSLILSPEYKDLQFVQEMYDDVGMDWIWLVDDDKAWIAPGQESQWIPIKCWDYKNPVMDLELQRVQDKITKEMLPFILAS